MTAWEIDVIRAGVIPQLSLSEFLPDADPGAVIDVPCLAFLVIGRAGTVLVDTGPNLAEARRAGFMVLGDPRGELLASLARRGRGADAVGWVIHTHLHYDHVGNDDVFTTARVVVQEREIQWALGPHADRFCVGANRWLADLENRLVEMRGEQEVLPGITVVPTGGHTPGHQAVVVETPTGMTCVAGDVVPLTANLVQTAPACPDPVAVRQFLERARARGWRVLPSHDPGLEGRDHG